MGDRVVFGGLSHTVVAFTGATIRLLSDSGATTMAGLGYLLAAEDFELVGAGSVPKVEPSGMLESLPEHVVAAARERERHLIEIDTGLPPDASPQAQPRPEYDPATQTIDVRCKAKAAELTAAGTKTSFRTIERMRSRYREQGLWGLVDTRSTCGARPTGRVDERVVEAAWAVVDAKTGTSTGTRLRVIRRMGELLDEQHGPGVVEMPSKTTLYRLLDALAKGRVHVLLGGDSAPDREQTGPGLHHDHGRVSRCSWMRLRWM